MNQSHNRDGGSTKWFAAILRIMRFPPTRDASGHFGTTSYAFGIARFGVAVKRTLRRGIASAVWLLITCLVRAFFILGRLLASTSLTQGGSRMPESGPFGFVRGAPSNGRPYRDQRPICLSGCRRCLAGGRAAFHRPGRPRFGDPAASRSVVHSSLPITSGADISCGR
jgi:hypothetical protein